MDFETFRRKLADCVTVAINSGRRVGPFDSGESQCCPMACFPVLSDFSFPTADDATRRRFPLQREQVLAFQDGVDGQWLIREDVHERHPEFYRLGRLYRERFSR